MSSHRAPTSTDYVRRVWGIFAEPRNITFLMCIIYCFFIGQGIVNISFPNPDVEETVPRTIVNSMLVGGGVVGLMAAPRGLWLFERPAIFALCGAYAIHLVWLVGDFNHDGDLEPQKCIRIIVILLFLISRYLRINKAMLDPAKN